MREKNEVLHALCSRRSIRLGYAAGNMPESVPRKAGQTFWLD